MWSMQCNVEFEYQLSICSGTKENHGKPWSNWPVAGLSGCKPTSRQQSGTKSASPNIIPYLCCCVCLLFSFVFSLPFFLFNNFIQLLYFFFSFFINSFLQLICAYDLDKHQTVYNTRGRNKRIYEYEQICIQIYIYLYLWFFDYR
jgi:hypothetical protein